MSVKRICADVEAAIAAVTKSDEWRGELVKAYDTPGNPFAGSTITREELDLLAELKHQGS
jgi:hypothetical protein